MCWGDEVLPGVLPSALALDLWKVSVHGGDTLQEQACGAHAASRCMSKALRSLSDALTLVAGSLQHLPVLNHVQTPSLPPGLGHGSPHSAAGFAGLRQSGLLHQILFVLLFGAEILDSAWVCT